ncbi:MAG: DNA-directed RNA polymerase subunit omega [Planctomycetes bacterium]|nr:DNA-directed RNA polymerase subunit omega [Planctomycetota bacterium]
MIEAFRNDDMINKVGGRFKLCALIQRRWLQLMQGARPMVETKGLTDLEVVVKEILEGKIEMEIPEVEKRDEQPT